MSYSFLILCLANIVTKLLLNPYDTINIIHANLEELIFTHYNIISLGIDIMYSNIIRCKVWVWYETIISHADPLIQNISEELR